MRNQSMMFSEQEAAAIFNSLTTEERGKLLTRLMRRVLVMGAALGASVGFGVAILVFKLTA